MGSRRFFWDCLWCLVQCRRVGRLRRWRGLVRPIRCSRPAKDWLGGPRRTGIGFGIGIILSLCLLGGGWLLGMVGSTAFGFVLPMGGVPGLRCGMSDPGIPGTTTGPRPE